MPTQAPMRTVRQTKKTGRRPYRSDKGPQSIGAVTRLAQRTQELSRRIEGRWILTNSLHGKKRSNTQVQGLDGLAKCLGQLRNGGQVDVRGQRA